MHNCVTTALKRESMKGKKKSFVNEAAGKGKRKRKSFVKCK
jgi:hypothetical protein